MAELYHYNHNHDPRTGRFTSSDVHSALKRDRIASPSPYLDIKDSLIGNTSLKKNTEVYRVTTSDEKLDNKRKYITVLQEDRDTYKSNFEYFVDIGKEAVENTYSIKISDAKIAGVKEVVDYVIDNTLDKYHPQAANNNQTKEENIKKAIMEFSDLNLSKSELDRLEYLNDKNFKNFPKSYEHLTEHDKYVLNKAYEGKDYTAGLLNSVYKDKKVSDDMIKYFADKGYDFIVDAEDYMWSEAIYPLIVLNPDKTLKLKSSKSI